jgi:4-amino-4-deoxy-L-arabinose transferase-like glycosyltransferase
MLGAMQLVMGAGLSGAGRHFIGGASQTYDPNMSAAFFMMALPYVMMFAMRPGKLRAVAALMVPALIMAMLKTASRGGMASFVALFVATIIVSQKRQRKTYVILLTMAVITRHLRRIRGSWSGSPALWRN